MTDAERWAVEQAAQCVKGVKVIAENFEVRPAMAQKTADEDSAKRALDIRAWAAGGPHETIHVKVQHGGVTSTGAVDWQLQRGAAKRASRQLGGDAGIANVITVKPKVVAPDIRRRIETHCGEVLRRSAASKSCVGRR
jgi:osmotically-inducible protein OsmY